MQWIRRAGRAAGGDAAQAVLFGALTSAGDLWLLSRPGCGPRGVAAVVFLGSAGALAGLGIGVVRGARARRRGAAPGARPGLRLVRCALTGALYVHLLLPVAFVTAFVVELVLHPQELILRLGGSVDRIDDGR
ncbi:hypothetical protein ABTY61_30520 [Kitasatospora sp. NPDC096128]|uniref:hypothetical protein n=1 Tax=Kitasatospora sp. NPDC096128 TaxID=3155547 RepID=UPI00331C8D68